LIAEVMDTFEDDERTFAAITGLFFVPITTSALTIIIKYTYQFLQKVQKRLNDR
jgi:hypothetical protein